MDNKNAWCISKKLEKSAFESFFFNHKFSESYVVSYAVIPSVLGQKQAGGLPRSRSAGALSETLPQM